MLGQLLSGNFIVQPHEAEQTEIGTAIMASSLQEGKLHGGLLCISDFLCSPKKGPNDVTLIKIDYRRRTLLGRVL